ncbi:superoxide dismutase [Stylonychia lemnae]|uniref:Superoxide dismutase n=1 Tax=Stylonychia lemnae TaxID=5949 RepID=A0A078AIH1_STYLE|nr:superoxide dismutase [Stylonychia lemnae]|eukprot:CDW80608.1 superoxide dismutase [Stylonychia lemnae]
MLLQGFCFGGLVLDQGSQSQILQLGYLSSTTISMGFGLLCLMFGQGRALRGEGTDSIDIAIENLKEKSYQCFKYFMLELLFFHISSFLLMWIYYRFLVALIINIILGLFLMLFVRNGYDIVKELYVEEGDAKSSELLLKRLNQNYADLGQFPIHAYCLIEPRSPTHNARGYVKLTQSSVLGVQLTGQISGLTPNGQHGFHIHEYGDLSNGCTSLGGHYNPFAHDHGAPEQTHNHVGDLGNIQADSQGVSNFDFMDKKIHLVGPFSIIGRSCQVHLLADDMGLGGTADSLKTGSAGARVGCGVIGRSPPPPAANL